MFVFSFKTVLKVLILIWVWKSLWEIFLIKLQLMPSIIWCNSYKCKFFVRCFLFCIGLQPGATAAWITWEACRCCRCCRPSLHNAIPFQTFNWWSTTWIESIWSVKIYCKLCHLIILHKANFYSNILQQNILWRHIAIK